MVMVVCEQNRHMNSVAGSVAEWMETISGEMKKSKHIPT